MAPHDPRGIASILDRIQRRRVRQDLLLRNPLRLRSPCHHLRFHKAVMRRPAGHNHPRRRTPLILAHRLAHPRQLSRRRVPVCIRWRTQHNQHVKMFLRRVLGGSQRPRNCRPGDQRHNRHHARHHPASHPTQSPASSWRRTSRGYLHDAVPAFLRRAQAECLQTPLYPAAQPVRRGSQIAAGTSHALSTISLNPFRVRREVSRSINCPSSRAAGSP